jgi:hypothetical protein
VYQSQHGFSGQRRVAKDVTALTSSFVNLDHYKVPDLSGLNADALLDRVRAVHQWLPVPTLIFNSGRGAYFQWLYPRPIGRDYLSKWQALEDILVELLAPFGADPQAKDPSRVLRVVGSTNQKTGAIVTGSRDTGPAISFDRLYSIVTKHCITDRKKAQEQVAEPTLVLASSTDAAVVLAQQPSAQRTRQEATAKQKANYLDPYKLAFYRIEDCRTLATLRGLMTDCRHRMLFVWAAAAAWYVSDEEQLRAELEAFAADHFQDAARYSADRVGSIIDRLRHDQQGGIARIWHGHRVPSRYKLSNRYIIGSLEISGAEQHHMKTIIGEEERQRRRLARRRTQGLSSARSISPTQPRNALELWSCATQWI